MFNGYEIRGEVTAVIARHQWQNVEILIDTADFELVSSIPDRWSIQKGGYRLYAVSNVIQPDGSLQSTPLHRFVLQPPKGVNVDHINRDGLDNRRSNLRLDTNNKNSSNTKLSKRNKSGYRGVCWSKVAKKWHCQISHKNTVHYLGLYSDAEEAARAYDEAARKFHGEFATLNFPDTPEEDTLGMIRFRPTTIFELPEDGFYSIDEVSMALGCHPDTIRNYEKYSRIKPPHRLPGGKRLFTGSHFKLIQKFLLGEL